LGRPIVGDELYGTKGGRLMLHAAEIWFTHPVKEVPMHFKRELEIEKMKRQPRQHVTTADNLKI
jgi:hypothetical protein